MKIGKMLRGKFAAAAVIALLTAATALAQSPIKATTTLHPDGSRTEFTTDTDERTGTSTTYNAAGKLMQKILYQLDEQNQPASGIFYNAKNQVVMKVVYRRDASNRITEQFEYAPNDKLIRRILFEFSGQKISKVRTFSPDGTELTPAKR